MILTSPTGCFKILRILSIALLFSLLLAACSAKTPSKDILSYQSNDFHFTVRGELWGSPFEGELTHVKATPPSHGDSYVLTFTAPAALSGITLTVDPQGTFVSLGDIVVPADAWDALTWTDMIRLFSLQGAPLTITPDEDGEQMTVVYLTTDGEGITITLNAQTEMPTRIETDGIWVEILSST